MRLFLLFFLLFPTFLQVFGQELSVNNLLTVATLPVAKTRSFITQKGYVLAGTSKQQDTVIQTYYFKGKNKKNSPDTIPRSLMHQTVNADMLIVYQTGCPREFGKLKRQLQEKGFWCHIDSCSPPSSDLLFQSRDMIVHASVQEGEDTLYAFQFQQKVLPQARDIHYAEDLLAFSSHENLVYIFGEKNVKKDLYYFSDKKFSRCSVLFPNTDRQAVFIWKDELNDYGLVYLVLGGQLMLESTKNYDLPVAENSWVLKSRLHAGMNLRELRRLNGMDFSFYTAGSKFSGMVLPVKSGNIDFRKESVVLACMNCNEADTAEKMTLSADEAIAEGKRLFVFTIMLYPGDPVSN